MCHHALTYREKMDCGGYFLLFILCMEVASQDPMALADVRLYTEGGLLFGGAVEVSTSYGWERVCYDGFTSNMGDIVCHKRGFEKGAMSVRPARSLGISVTPLPSLACQFSTVAGEEIHCQYATTCTDHAVVICNYPGYLGCYHHTRSSPSLTDASFVHSNMTVQFCLAFCRQMSYPYAGVAFGQECYCETQGIDMLASKKLGNEDCFLPCVGDPLQTCGGGTAAGIYDSRLGSCNKNFTDVEGAIASPGFPGKYSNDEHCTWSVIALNAANITVRIHLLDLYSGDKLSIATPLMSELVSFTGGSNPSNSIRFESSSHSLDARLAFTFTGDTISVTFNSTMTSLGSQGLVLTFSSAIGPSIVSSMPINATETPTPTSVTSQPINPTTMKESVTPPPGLTSQRTHSTTSPLTPALTDDYIGTTQTLMIAPNTVTDDAPPNTPRSVTMIGPDDSMGSPSIAVILAIAIGIILILVLTLTAAVLFTTSYKHERTRTRRRDHNAAAHINAAYAITDENDGQTDSGIYDPGYENADVEEPIYLSIRNDPRAKPSQYIDSEKRDSNKPYSSISRNASVKTTKTDHDYQSVDGLSRRNTERSYISIYADGKGSTSTDVRVSAIREPSDSCSVAEDGYMVPTPKNSTQIQQTKL